MSKASHYLEKIFSCKNEMHGDKKCKIVRIFGIKILRHVVAKNVVANPAVEPKPETPVYSNDFLADLEGGFLRMRLTHQCNCRCKWCGQLWWPQEVQDASLDKKVIYEYCRPLYGRAKTILCGGGEITYAKEGFNFVKFLSEEYPAVNLLTESNGILYDKKWVDLAIANLNKAHFSVNAAHGNIYAEAVWKEGGEKIFERVMNNIKTAAQRWQDVGMPYFAPSISMVVTRESACDIYDFVKMALENKLLAANFYFDQNEGSKIGDGFLYPEIFEPALKTAMEIERVLAKKFNVYFRLWLPLNCTQKLQAEVEAMPIEQLREKYAELLELAKDRDMIKEWQQRNEARKAKHKKLLTIEEEYFPSLHAENRRDAFGRVRPICFAPFKSFDVMADGTIILCGWSAWELNIKDFIEDDGINWSKLLNHPVYQDFRARVLRDDFSRCMDCCPLHPKNPHLNQILKYGLERETP